MKRVAPHLLTIMFSIATVFACGMDQRYVKADEPCAIKHCPPGTKCRPEPKPCDPVIVEKKVEVPGPERLVPVPVPGPKEIVTNTVVKEVPGPERLVPVPFKGGWSVPLSVGASNRVELAAAGLGYQFKSRWQISGQLFHARQHADRMTETIINESTTTAPLMNDSVFSASHGHHCDPQSGHGNDGNHGHHNCDPGDPGDPPTSITSSREITVKPRDQNSWGFLFTVNIPLGKR